VFPYVIVLCEQGEVRQARELAESVRLRSQAAGDRLHLAYATYALGRVAHAQGRLDEAMRLYDAAVFQLGQLGLQTRLWEVVGVLIEKGDLNAAAMAADRVERFYRKAKNADRELAGVGARLHVLLARGKVAEATEVALRERLLATGTESFRVRQIARIDLAKLDAAIGNKRDDALRQLQTVMDDARRRGFVQTELEARLAWCEVTGRQSATELSQLREDAQAKGFGLLAAKAGRVLAEQR
jgi:tetratricopeptide (TPR) repeat protein